jgi:hypothetical protein
VSGAKVPLGWENEPGIGPIEAKADVFNIDQTFEISI